MKLTFNMHVLWKSLILTYIFMKVFPGVQLTISQQWFIRWLEGKQAASYYLTQCWPISANTLGATVGHKLLNIGLREIYNGEAGTASVTIDIHVLLSRVLLHIRLNHAYNITPFAYRFAAKCRCPFGRSHFRHRKSSIYALLVWSGNINHYSSHYSSLGVCMICYKVSVFLGALTYVWNILSEYSFYNVSS